MELEKQQKNGAIMKDLQRRREAKAAEKAAERLKAEARAAAVRARVEERRRSENAERQAEQQTIFTDPIADRDDVGNFMDQLK